MKTSNPGLAALAACLLIAGTVLIPSSKLAAQQPAANDKDADRARQLEASRQDLEKVKAELADLRAVLERERKRAEQAELEARAQRDVARQAEAEARRRAEQALAAVQAARQEADKAKREADRARYAAEIHAAQAAFGKEKEQAGKSGAQQLLQELEREKMALMTRFQAQRVELMTQLKRLDEEQQRVLEDLAKKAAGVRANLEPRGNPAHPDRLDLILGLLQRIEGRLDQLEKQLPKKASGKGGFPGGKGQK